MAGISGRVYALTGLGLMGARADVAGRMARIALRQLIRGPLASKQTRFLFENPDDAIALGLDPADTAVTIVGGAGIDPALLAETPQPPSPPSWPGGLRWSAPPGRLRRQGPCAIAALDAGRPDPPLRAGARFPLMPF